MGESKQVFIRDLARIVDREVGTIRGWERDERLPKKLMPKRNDRDWRYWSPAQVEGIKKWMKKNDMRPGSALAKPENEKRHLENLRQPKYLPQSIVRRAHTMSKNGKTQIQIARELFEKTAYTSEEAFLSALLKAFKKRKWYPPPYDDEAKARRKAADESRSVKHTARHIVAKELGVSPSLITKKPAGRRKVAA
jgi:hypothetical protein